MHRTCWMGVLLTSVLVTACKTDKPEGDKPPPAPAESAGKPSACAGGGGQVTDPPSAAVFPRTVAGYCVDPNGETRVFGEGGKLSMDAVCTDAFDGECEVYKGLGLKRVVHLRYVDGAGSPGSAEIYLSQFATTEGAYALFTKRVVADSDPIEGGPRPLDAGGAGALGTGRAYVWKGQDLAEIQYANEDETPVQMKASSDRLLVPLAQEIGTKLPGKPTLPPSAARLPSEKRLPHGISYAAKEVLGVAGAGGGAIGYYRDGDKRYRVVSIVRDDPDQAKDVLRTLAKVKGSTEEKGLGEGAYHVILTDRDGAKLDWYFARSGKLVTGVGDEEFVVSQGMPAAEREKVSLSRDEKVNLLKQWVSKP